MYMSLGHHDVAPRTLSTMFVSLLLFLDAKIHFVVILAVDEDVVNA